MRTLRAAGLATRAGEHARGRLIETMACQTPTPRGICRAPGSARSPRGRTPPSNPLDSPPPLVAVLALLAVRRAAEVGAFSTSRERNGPGWQVARPAVGHGRTKPPCVVGCSSARTSLRLPVTPLDSARKILRTDRDEGHMAAFRAPSFEQGTTTSPALDGVSEPAATSERVRVLVTTRMRFRTPLALVQALRWQRRVERAARGTPGFLHSTFLIEGPTTFVTFSLWASRHAIDLFQARAAEEHGQAAKWAFLRAVERWSVTCDDVHVSPSSHSWGNTW